MVFDYRKNTDNGNSQEINPEIALTIGPAGDTVGETVVSAGSLSIGSSITGFINTSTDEDWFEITLVAGQTYEFSLNGTNSSGTGALSDPYLRLYDASGTQISYNDDGGPGFNSLLSFTATSSGTYYIAADAFVNATGEYTLSASTPPPPSALDSIDWGTIAPTVGGVISVYFAVGGETYDGVTSQGWSAYEIQQAMAAFAVFEDVINVTFNQVFDPAQSQFQLVTTTNVPYSGYFNPPGTFNAGVGVFATDAAGWNATGGLEAGGFGFILLLHEFGHALGLAHPHDNGGSSTIMDGVTSPQGDLGDFDLNQGVNTVMTYNDGWQTAPHGTSSSNNYGWQSSLMALDIAILQDKYGVNTNFNNGNNTYVLPVSNGGGTSYSAIWDTGGIDTILHIGYLGTTIDLRAATLNYENGGGGYISYVTGIHGGFTIANDVLIENATGGYGNDIIIGNGANNFLNGRSGNDYIYSGFGNDILLGGLGFDYLYGDAGLDWLYGGADNDFLSGGGDNDALFGEFGDDTLDGGTGDDWLSGGDGNDILSGGAGNDGLYGGDGDDWISGGDGNDIISSDAGNDGLLGGNGDDWFSGGAGNDVINGDAGADGLYGGDGDDWLSGGAGNDVLSGDAGNDGLYGGDGDDWLSGGAGNDVINGDAGVDWIFGGDGSDFISGGADADFIYGQGGTDVFIFDSLGWGYDYIYDFANDGFEKIDMSGSGLGMGDLNVTISGGNTLITFVGSADAITLIGITSGIDASDFIF